MGKAKSNFNITDHKGFQLTFENGWTVSVQWGVYNYCDHHHGKDFDAARKADGNWESSTAEIAAWDKNDNWYQFPSDTVKGYVQADDVAKFIGKIQRKKAQ